MSTEDETPAPDTEPAEVDETPAAPDVDDDDKPLTARKLRELLAERDAAKAAAKPAVKKAAAPAKKAAPPPAAEPAADKPAPPRARTSSDLWRRG